MPFHHLVKCASCDYLTTAHDHNKLCKTCEIPMAFTGESLFTPNIETFCPECHATSVQSLPKTSCLACKVGQLEPALLSAFSLSQCTHCAGYSVENEPNSLCQSCCQGNFHRVPIVNIGNPDHVPEHLQNFS